MKNSNYGIRDPKTVLVLIVTMLSSALVWTWNMIDKIMSLSTENLKLKSDNFIKFLIWSLPAEMTCPFATPHCKKFCYAKKSEKNYPDVLPARNFNFWLSQTEFFVPVMVRLFHEIAKKPSYKKALHIFVRIHESGDFYNKAYMLKWYQIAEQCKDIVNLSFITYTKSFLYIEQLKAEGIEIPKNLVFRASIWDDTTSDQLKRIIDMDLPIYTAYEKGKFPADYFHCDCENCATCRACFTNKIRKIACEIH